MTSSKHSFAKKLLAFFVVFPISPFVLLATKMHRSDAKTAEIIGKPSTNERGHYGKTAKACR
jgi:hypothetical protein